MKNYISDSIQVFLLSLLKEKLDAGVKKEVDGMGVPDIKYGDSVCYIQHVATCLWLTYQTVDAKCARMGGVQRKVPFAALNCLCFLELQSMLELLCVQRVDRMYHQCTL